MDIKYAFIGWCHDPDKNHDKVWGAIELKREYASRHVYFVDYLTFWGRRGKKLQTQTANLAVWEFQNLLRSKEKKGYKQINAKDLSKVYPEFQDDLEKTMVWSLLTN